MNVSEIAVARWNGTVPVPVNAESVGGSVALTLVAASSRAVKGCATADGPTKSRVPSNAASVCDGIRGIVLTQPAVYTPATHVLR